jgi:DNA-binding response OmpR family regulator
MEKQTILVVDDDRNIRKLLTAYLQNEGFDVVEAKDGNIALAQLNKREPSIVIVDFMMPGLKGWQVCREIKKIKNIPVIIITACDDETTKILSFDAGADDFLTKPFNPMELVLRIKAILRRTKGI